jgi:hypothetical protein
VQISGDAAMQLMSASRGRRRLSSVLTPVYKIFFPVLCCAVFGAATISAVTTDGTPWPPLMIPWLVGSGFLFAYGLPLKAVFIDDSHLFVSGIWREEAIALSNIAEITERVFFNPRRIWVRFRTPTSFGNTIVFMPTVSFALWRPHPTVAELRRAAEENRV